MGNVSVGAFSVIVKTDGSFAALVYRDYDNLNTPEQMKQPDALQLQRGCSGGTQRAGAGGGGTSSGTVQYSTVQYTVGKGRRRWNLIRNSRRMSCAILNLCYALLQKCNPFHQKNPRKQR